MWVYVALWFITTAWGFWLGERDTVLAGIFLSFILWGFWNHDLWADAGQMLSFHLLLLMAMVLTPKSKFWRWFFGITMVMVFADTFWMMMPDIEPWLRTILPEMQHLFPYHYFWWQSTLYILFCLLIAHSLRLCTLTHRERRLNRMLQNGNIWAFIGTRIASTKIHSHNKI